MDSASVEPLHPELSRFVVNDRKLGPVLQHPLVYCVPYFPQFAPDLNQHFLAKRSSLETATQRKMWGSVLALHERPWRFNVFTKFHHEMTDSEYWTHLHWLWVDSENIWQDKPRWKEFLSSKRPGSFMRDEEREMFDGLPDVITVYRGYTKGKNFHGLSYTLDRNVAVKLCRRKDELAAVRVRQIAKRRAFAYTNDRNEQEIIIL